MHLSAKTSLSVLALCSQAVFNNHISTLLPVSREKFMLPRAAEGNSFCLGSLTSLLFLLLLLLLSFSELVSWMYCNTMARVCLVLTNSQSTSTTHSGTPRKLVIHRIRMNKCDSVQHSSAHRMIVNVTAQVYCFLTNEVFTFFKVHYER